MKAVFDDERFGWSIDGAAVQDLTAKGAAAGIARESKANISILAQRLQNQVITLQEWYDGMKRETKFLQMAEYALGMGGIDQVTDWSDAEQIIAGQWNGQGIKGEAGYFPGLRAFGEDIQAGRYGTQSISTAVLARGIQYGDSGRATYENSRLKAQIESFTAEAKRTMAAVERHCTDCPTWAAMGWILATLMYSDYAIGMSACNVLCYCIIVTRRAAEDAAQAVGKSAVLALMQHAAKAAGGASAVFVALAIFRYARNNPTAVSFALKLLLGALEARTV